jgi:NAD+ diphosphatase
LGLWRGQAHLAIEVDRIPEGYRSAGLRQWFGVLPDESLAIAMRAAQLLQWSRTHRFCGACGRPTTAVAGERARRCEPCNLSSYPRISPAMMVLITRGRQLLLARGRQFPPGRYSALAGFLEAGETIEQAIRREVQEEVGVAIQGLRYFGSQSWPFPHSLMIAFRAEWAGGEISIDHNELADARWFDPTDLPQLPPPLSIARALIDGTLNELALGPPG